MADSFAGTVNYYNRHAVQFEEQTAQLDLTSHQGRFLRHVVAGGRILDAGCGVGRDALAFLEKGHSVTAFDASEEMVRFARVRLGGRVVLHWMRFEDMCWCGEFDGIWACASLVHVPPASFAGVASRLAVALRPGGAWYMSFKLGEGVRSDGARIFLDHNEETLRTSLRDAPVEITDVWTSHDVRPGREDERWLNAIAVRLPQTAGLEKVTAAANPIP